MNTSNKEIPQILYIHLRIAQFPILASKIRDRMRRELYQRGIITSENLEQEVKEKALESQFREGLNDPFIEENESQWRQRLNIVRDYLTDFYFANNLPLDLFNQIVDEILPARSSQRKGTSLNFNPELAPIDLILQEAEKFESLPSDKKAEVQHDLEELIVVLTKTMVSDQLNFIRIAKKFFQASDFKFIKERRIGSGKIGGKAAGMLLAWKILKKAAPEIVEQIKIPNSYFLGADVVYDFMSVNGLEYFNQKYKTTEEIWQEYPQILREYEQGRLPEEIETQLLEILKEIGKKPLVVRSSSLLEDNLGFSFAGKYASLFCPNQGTPEQNLKELVKTIGKIYGSIFSPDALFYRRRMGLLDYDERMAILIQEVIGKQYRNYFFPDFAGVGFSRCPIAWSNRIKREEGFTRMVLGLGTRALERVGEDYPRIIALSHPALRPEATPEAIRKYSQKFIDLIDIESNSLTSLPIIKTIGTDYPSLPVVASVYRDGMLIPVSPMEYQLTPDKLVLTFDNLIAGNKFIPLIKSILITLEKNYGVPVDVEFAVNISYEQSEPKLHFYLLQCRPQSRIKEAESCQLPVGIPEQNKIFLSTRMIPVGRISEIEHIVYVHPENYYKLTTQYQHSTVARTIGKLNKILESHNFILIGPGRWGSANSYLGVPVTYADIYNAKALIEIAIPSEGVTPEPSYGTHFFQDLMESQIYPLAIFLDGSGDYLNQEFLNNAENFLLKFLPEAGELMEVIKLILIPNARKSHFLEIIMDGKEALGYLKPC